MLTSWPQRVKERAVSIKKDGNISLLAVVEGDRTMCSIFFEMVYRLKSKSKVSYKTYSFIATLKVTKE
jgi:hypothetical protein